MDSAIFKSMNDVCADAAYEYYFSGKANETEYKNPLRKTNKLNVENGFLEKYLKDAFEQVPKLEKAISSTAITAPTIIDAEIVDRLQQETPIVELVRRVTNKGKVISYNAHTGRTDAAFLTEGASLNDQDDTYTNVTDNVKYSYAVGGVTGVARAHEAHYIDALAQTIRDKTTALRYLHEETFFSGNATTNALEYNGLDNIITTNTDNKSSSAILLDDVGTMLDASRTYGGRGKKISSTDYATLRDVKSQMMANVHYIDKTTIAWGLTAVQYEDMPIVPSRFVETTSGSRRFYIWDSDMTEYRVLQEPVMEELAKTYDANRFFIKEYSAPIVKHEARCAMIYGIS
jgi:hypothetical protein